MVNARGRVRVSTSRADHRLAALASISTARLAPARANQPRAPFEHSRLGTIPAGPLGRVGFAPVAASLHQTSNLTRAAAALPKVIGAGGSLLITAVFARPLPVLVIKRVTEPARRQNASKCHQQGNDKRCPQDHHDGVLFLLLLQTSRLPHAGTVVSAPYPSAISAGSGST